MKFILNKSSEGFKIMSSRNELKDNPTSKFFILDLNIILHFQYKIITHQNVDSRQHFKQILRFILPAQRSVSSHVRLSETWS